MTTYTLRPSDSTMRALPRAAPLQTCATLHAAINALDVETLIHDITGPHTGQQLLQIVITSDETPDTPGEVLVYYATYS